MTLKDTDMALAETEGRRTKIGESLSRYLGPEYVSYRVGEGGKKLAYLEGHEIDGLMNEIFGWDGWNHSVLRSELHYALEGNGMKWSVGMSVTVRVTVTTHAGGKPREVYHEDVGYGMMDNAKSRGQAMEKSHKEGVTDALKRACRHFGNATGGCFYNKEYLERIRKVRGPAERIDFDPETLHFKQVNRRQRMKLHHERNMAFNGQVIPSPAVEEDFEEDDEMFAGLDDEGGSCKGRQ